MTPATLRFLRSGVLVLGACVGPGKVSVEEPGDDTAGKRDSSGVDTAPDETGDTAPPDTAETGDTTGTEPPPPPCTTWAAPVEVGTLDDAERDEVSGVAASARHPGVLWLHVDHGGDAALYAVDATGGSLGALTLDGVENVDWEALAIGPCDAADPDGGDCLWVADVGDNRLERDEVVLYRVPEPEVGADGLETTVTPDRFPLVYAEGPRNVEAMFLAPDGSPVLLTKQGSGDSEVYVVDATEPDVPTAPRLVGAFPTRPEGVEEGGFVTSADLWPDGTRLLVRTYERTWELDLGESGVEGIAEATPLDVPFAAVPHVEAIAYDPALRGYWQVPEAVNAGIVFVACLD